MATFHHERDLSSSFVRRRKNKPKTLIRCAKLNNTKTNINLYEESSNELIDVTSNDTTLASPVEVSIDIFDLLPNFEGIQIEPDTTSFHKESVPNLDFDNSSHSKFRVTDCDVVEPPLPQKPAFEDGDVGCHSEAEDFVEVHSPRKDHQSTNGDINVPVCPNDIINLNLVLEKSLKVSCEKLDLEQFCKLNRYRRISAETVSLKPIPVSPKPVENHDEKRTLTLKNIFNKSREDSSRHTPIIVSTSSQDIIKSTSSCTRPIVIWSLNPRNQPDADSAKTSFTDASDKQQVTGDSSIDSLTTQTQNSSNLNLSSSTMNISSSDASIRDSAVMADVSAIDSMANNLDLENLDFSSLENEESMRELIKELKTLLGVSTEPQDASSPCLKTINGDNLSSNNNNMVSTLPNAVFSPSLDSSGVSGQYNNVNVNKKMGSSTAPRIIKCHRSPSVEGGKLLYEPTSSSSSVYRNSAIFKTSTPIEKLSPRLINSQAPPRSSIKFNKVISKNQTQSKEVVTEKTRTLDDIKSEMESFMLSAKPAVSKKTKVGVVGRKGPSVQSYKPVTPKIGALHKVVESIPNPDFGCSRYNAELDGLLFGASSDDFSYSYDDDPLSSESTFDSSISKTTLNSTKEKVSETSDTVLESSSQKDLESPTSDISKISNIALDNSEKLELKNSRKKPSKNVAARSREKVVESSNKVSDKSDTVSESTKRRSKKSAVALDSSNKVDSKGSNRKFSKKSKVVSNSLGKTVAGVSKQSDTISDNSKKGDTEQFSQFILDNIKKENEPPSDEVEGLDSGKDEDMACSVRQNENLKDKKKSLKCSFKKSPIMKVKISPFPFRSKKLKDKSEMLNKKKNYQVFLKKRRMRRNIANDSDSSENESVNTSADDTNLSSKDVDENSNPMHSTKAKRKPSIKCADKNFSNSVSPKAFTDFNTSSHNEDHEKENNNMTGNSFASRSNDSEGQDIIEKILEPNKEEVQYSSESESRLKDSEPKIEKSTTREKVKNDFHGLEEVGDSLSVSIDIEQETSIRTATMDISPGIAPSRSPIPPDKEKTDALDRSSLSTLNSPENVTSNNDQTSSKVSQNITDAQKVDDLSSSTGKQSIDSKEAEKTALGSSEEQQGANENLSNSITGKRPDKKGSIEEKDISAKSKNLPDLIQSITKINEGEQSLSKENQKEQSVEIIENLETLATDITSDSKLMTEKVQKQTDSTLADSIKESAINGDDRKMQIESEANSKINVKERDSETHVEETNAERIIEETNSENHVKETNAERIIEETNSENYVKETNSERIIEETNSEKHVKETNAERIIEETNSENHVKETNAERIIEETNSEKHVKETNSEMHVEETNAEAIIKTSNSKIHVQEADSEKHMEETNTETITEKTNSEKHIKETSNEDMPVEVMPEILSNSEAIPKKNDTSDHEIEQPSAEEPVDKKLVSSSVQNTALEQSSLIQPDETVTSTVTSKETTRSELKELLQQKDDELTDKQIIEVEQSWSESSRQLEADLELSDDSSDNLIIVDETNDNNVSAEEEIKEKVLAKEKDEKSKSVSDSPSETPSKNVKGTKVQSDEISTLTSSKKTKVRFRKNTKDKSVEKLKLSCVKDTKTKKIEDTSIKNWVISNSSVPEKQEKEEKPTKQKSTADDHDIMSKAPVLKISKLDDEYHLKSSTPPASDVSSTAAEPASKNTKVPGRTPRTKIKKRPFSPTESMPSPVVSKSMPSPVVSKSMPSPVVSNPVKSSLPVVESMSGSQSTKKKKFSEEDVVKPFKFGWMREVVHRAAVGKKLTRQSDVYYFNPEGGKLRSMPEIAKYLAEHKGSGLTIQNFTFVKETIYRKPFEQERDAKVKSTLIVATESSKKKEPPSVKKAEVSAVKRKADSELNESIPAKKARLKESKSDTPDKVSQVKDTKDADVKNSNKLKSTKASADSSSKLKSKRDSLPTIKVKIVKVSPKQKDSASKSLTPLSGGEIEQDLQQILTSSSDKKEAGKRTGEKGAGKRTDETESEKRTDKKGSEKETEKIKASETRKKARIKYTPPRSKKQTQNVYSAHH